MKANELEQSSSLPAGILLHAKHNWSLIVLGLGLEFEFVAWLTLTGTSAWNLLGPCFLALFTTYLIVLFYIRKRKGTPQVKSALAVIAVFAIVFRLTLLFSTPVLSSDIYRYYWEGKVVANGYNPYLYSPDAPQLTSLRDPVWEFLNLRYVEASYPPFLELLFALIYIPFHSILAYKIVFFILDLALIGVIYLLLRELKFNRVNVAVYAWAPLPIIEVAQTGHNDPIVVLLLFVSFLLFLRAKNITAAHIMGLSVVTKFYPVFLAPTLFKRWGKRATAVFIATVLAFYAPLLTMGWDLFNGLLFAINTSFFNGSLFPAILWLLSTSGIFQNPGFVTQVVTYVIFALILVWTFFLRHSETDQRSDFMKISFEVVGALLLLNRSFFPWYVVWIVPFLVFVPSIAWLYLSGSIFMGYLKYSSFPPPSYEAVDPQTHMLIDLAQYLPFYILLAYELFKNHHGGFRGLRSRENRSTTLYNPLDS